MMLSDSPSQNSIAGPSRIGIDHPLASFAMSIGSLRSQFYPGCSPGTLMGPLDLPDLKISSNLDKDAAFSMPSGSWRAMLSSAPKVDASICRDYTCCGLCLTDLHALVEHFEEHHVVVVDEPHAFMPPQPLMINTNSSNTVSPVQPSVAPSATSEAANSSTTSPIQSSEMSDQDTTISPSTAHPMTAIGMATATSTTTTSEHSSPSVDIDTMDDMDIDMDVDMELESNSSQSGPDTHSGSSTPSPPLTPVLPFDTTSVQARRHTIPLLSSQISRPGSPREPDLERAFNRYAGYTEFSSMLPGTEAVGVTMFGSGRQMQSVAAIKAALNGGGIMPQKSCLPPSLLTSASSTATTTPASTRPSSPCSSISSTPLPPRLKIPPASALGHRSNSISSQPSALLLSKPFRCPKPGCNKSYKQANGLKYHIQHGSCNFAPRDETLDTLSEQELEEKLKPFRCGVGPCERRYKNMNGLRYHYQHSGAHGAIGLALLASGTHDGVNTATAVPVPTTTSQGRSKSMST